MLTGFIKASGEGLRNLARNLFPGFYERGISANNALLELRGQGLGYRRQDFLADFRQGLADYGKSTYVSRLPDGNVPKENGLLSKYHGTPDRYSFVFKASGIDPTTGEAADRYFFQHRNSLDRVGNMKDDANSWFADQAEGYELEVSKVSLVEGYVNPGWKG